MQDLKPIRVFLEVAALQSFTAAARSLRMTPASVTRIVARLESEIGQQLLLRTTRQVSLTSAGAVLAARYRPAIEEFDRIAREFERQSHPHRGRLAINTPMSFGQRLMPSLVESFRLAYPNVELVIRMTDRLVDIVQEDCDLAIRLSDPPTDKSTIWRRVCEIPRMIVASPQFLELHGHPSTPDDFDSQTCLSYGGGKEPETWHLRNGAMKRTLTAGSAVIGNNGDFLCALAASGAGMAMLPEFIVSGSLKSGTLVQVLPDWIPSPLALSLYYPPYEALPPLVATFTDFFDAYLADLDGFDFATSQSSWD